MTTQTAQSDLVARVATWQRRRRLTDAAFASRLGISRSYWSLIRSGRKQPNLTFYRGVLRECDDLRDDALSFLRSEVTVSTKSGDKE